MLPVLGPHLAVLSLNPASATPGCSSLAVPPLRPLCSPRAFGSSHLPSPLSATVASPLASLKRTSLKSQPNCRSLTLSGLAGVPLQLPLSTRVPRYQRAACISHQTTRRGCAGLHGESSCIPGTRLPGTRAVCVSVDCNGKLARGKLLL